MYSEDRDGAIALRVKTASVFNSDKQISSRKFHLLFRTEDRSQRSKTKLGSRLEWDDYFYYNVRDMEVDDLVISLFMDNEEVGAYKLTYKRIKKLEFDNDEIRKLTLPLELNERHSGNLEIEIQKLRSEQIVGGVQPPMITLKPGAPLDQSIDMQQTRGIQKIRTVKLNFFSVCDANDLGREFMPPKFQSKSIEGFLMRKSLNNTGVIQNSSYHQNDRDASYLQSQRRDSSNHDLQKVAGHHQQEKVSYHQQPKDNSYNHNSTYQNNNSTYQNNNHNSAAYENNNHNSTYENNNHNSNYNHNSSKVDENRPIT